MARSISGLRLVAFLIIAALLAFLIAKVLAFALHLFWVLTGYIFAFVIAVVLLSWLWSRFSKPSGSVQSRPDDGRDEFGRRRY
jgi:membrane protein implicated in regulation of membrane protease activity